MDDEMPTAGRKIPPSLRDPGMVKMAENSTPLTEALNEVLDVFQKTLDRTAPDLRPREIGTVISVGQGVARVRGLPGVGSEELVRFEGNRMGMIFNLDPEEIGVVLLDESEQIEAGSRVRMTGRVVDAPVGEALLGRIVDPVGRPLDGGRPLRGSRRRPVERDAPDVLDRLPVSVPLQTGIQAVDALIPIGRGQRELIIGDRQTGKTSVAVDTIIAQKETEVICIYCSIGQRSSAVAKVIDDLRQHGDMEKVIAVVTTGENEPALKFISPYAATAMGEYFMEQGRDVLVVFDDLTQHARAYRELSLLLRRPPAREAYPGDIFYIHSRLLERSTHLDRDHGGGSLTALPIVETQAQNISAYIPTNLISITDGQIYLSPELFQKGILPAVDVGRSVSRVGGKTQLPAYRSVAGDLRLSYSQFGELEKFARFGTQMDEQTRQTLRRGRRVREVLKQPTYHPIPVPEQIGILLAMTNGLFDELALDRVEKAKENIRQAVREQLDDQAEKILQGKELEDEERRHIVKTCREAVKDLMESDDHGDS
jgi:F-type H+-transporting ATPase subunit alpha